MKYGQMDLSVEVVSPATAENWLKRNATNRPLRKKVVESYARDMDRATWSEKPVAICFDENGLLGNGQHTLHAIIASGKSQRILIARNVSSASIAAMDIGLKRTVNDLAHFLGADIDGRRAAIARVIEFGVNDFEQRNYIEIMDAYEKHRDMIDLVVSFAPSKTIGQGAIILGVCARALYMHPAEKVSRFLEVVRTGIANGDEESSAVRLRDVIRSPKGGVGRTKRAELYRKTESALAAFLSGKAMSKIYGSTTEMFPVPSWR